MARKEKVFRVRRNKIKKTPGERIFNVFNILLMLIMCFIMVYPFWYCLIRSFNDGLDATRGNIWFWPRKFTIDNYVKLLSYRILLTSYRVTIARTVIGSLLSLVVTGLCAYAMTKKQLPGRNVIITIFMIPMFIGGTAVSNYIVMSRLHMLDTFWIYIIPGCFGFFNMIIMRTYFYGIPTSLEESAKIDGAGYMRIFFRLIVPLSMPVIACILLFNAVGNWLDFYTNLLYVKNNKQLYVAQYVLYLIINANQPATMKEGGQAPEMKSTANVTPEVLKMAILMFITAPILFLYPFLQKYFVQGVLIGAVKE